MTTPSTPSNPKTPGSNKPAEGAAPAVSSIDEHLHGFWKKNGQAITVLCAIVLIFYVGKLGWEYFAAQREASLESEFAAATTPEKLEAFAVAHSGHVLAGVARLQLADFAYAQQRSAAAVDGYAKAAAELKAGALASRAQLGLAMAKIQAGSAAEGEELLRQLSGDVRQFKAIRAEATYQLASLAASAGKADEVQKLALQVMQIDPNSPWAQRAFALQSRLPAAAAAPAPASSATPSVIFKPKP